MSQLLHEPPPPPELPDYQPIKPERRFRSLLRRLFAPLAALTALLSKFGSALGVILKLKVLTTSASMLVSVAAYAWIWGWRFAVGFVLLLFVHELGHVLELRRQGVPASAPLFIPFLGAVVGMRGLPENAWKEARVALAGPILGSLGAAAVWFAGSALDSTLLKAVAFTGFFLNLFNLIPVVPLDGGRAAAAVSPVLWLVGLAGLLALAVFWHNPIILVILLIGGAELWRRWRERHHPERAAYYRIPPWQRVVVAVVYIGLAASLVLAMSATHIPRHF